MTLASIFGSFKFTEFNFMFNTRFFYLNYFTFWNMINIYQVKKNIIF